MNPKKAAPSQSARQVKHRAKGIDRDAATANAARDFAKFAYERFDPEWVARELMKHGFAGYRASLLAAFRVWVLAPTAKTTRNHALLRTIAHIHDDDLRKREQNPKEREKNESLWSEADDRQKFAAIFDAMGGWKSKQKGDSKATIVRKLKLQSVELRYALRVVEILHYVMAQVPPEKINSMRQKWKLAGPSLNKAYDLAGQFGPVGEESPRKPKKSTVQRAWRKHKASLAFAYAASRLPISDTRSLLDYLGDRDFKWRDARLHMKEWFGKAAYVNSAIFDRLPRARDKKTTIVRSPSTTPLMFGPPSFSHDELAAIRAGHAPLFGDPVPSPEAALLQTK